MKKGEQMTYEEALLRRMENPERKLRFVHIAGTNGKGSTAVMLASILQAAGFHTGLFISPFIHCFNERMQIDGSPITDEELIELTARIRPLAESMEDKPTEFELITALAFSYFHKNRCDIVVLEVGLGGELDSTNVIGTPEAAVITALGDTIREIARAKAGIIKEGGDVIFYGRNQEALSVIREAAKTKNNTLMIPDYQSLRLQKRDLSGQSFSYGRYSNLQIRLLGTYQVNNAAVVIETIEVLRKRGWAVSDEALRKGLLSARWTGRLELVRDHPRVFVDGSHNPQGVQATAKSLRTYFPQENIIFLTGVLADKDVAGMMCELPELARCFITVKPPGMRGMEAEELAQCLRRLTDKKVQAAESLEEGCMLALAEAGEDGVICAIGSLYMVGELTKIFQRLLPQNER